MRLSPFTIWTSPDRSRYFLLPDGLDLPSGPFAIRAPLGKHQSVGPESLLAYELSEHQAKVWIASEVTGLLESIPKTPFQTGEKILAAAHLTRELPELIRLSKDSQTLPRASEAGHALDQLLSSAGIDSHSAFSQLPAQIRKICEDPDIQDKIRYIQQQLDQISEKIEIPSLRTFLHNLSSPTAKK